jgi:hypothetical protein
LRSQNHERKCEIRQDRRMSDEDQCDVGSSPGLVYGGCHGTDEKAVFEELCEVVEEAIAI